MNNNNCTNWLKYGKGSRFKILSLSYNIIMSCLVKVSSKTILEWPTLPEGYEIVTVWQCPRAGAFKFLIFHSSFDIVPQGAKAPEIGADEIGLTLVNYLLSTDED